MVNYLYPGQAPQVYVPELNRFVDAYDTPNDVPDSTTPGTYVAIQQDISNSGFQSGQMYYSRPMAIQAQIPGISPVLCLIIIIIILMTIISALTWWIGRTDAKYSMDQQPDTQLTTCEDNTTCYGAMQKYGSCYYHWDCCTGTTTKLNCETDWTTLLIMVAVAGIGGYAAIKILGLLPKKEAKK